MDTTTYASLAVIPWTLAENNERPVVPEVELTPLDLAALASINGYPIFICQGRRFQPTTLGGAVDAAAG
jgi:hypothetical protein